MAEKRMLSNKIVQLDNFLDLPATSQNLYFHLNMDADDEGFVSSPKKVMRIIGASQKDMELLIQENFVIGFGTGVIVIRHWKIHNSIRKDRIKLSLYEKEKSYLIENNGVYELVVLTDGQPNDNQVTTKCPHRLEEIKLEEIRLEKSRYARAREDSTLQTQNVQSASKSQKKQNAVIVHFENKEVNETFEDFLKLRMQLKAKNTDRAVKMLINKVNEYADNDTERVELIEQSIMNSWKGIFPFKNNNSKKSNELTIEDWEKL